LPVKLLIILGAINDVFSRYPTDKPKVSVPTSEQKQKEQNIIKNITHKLFGTISEYNVFNQC
jgi:hypothetical protein